MSAYRTAAITDEFTPDDLDAALTGMAAVGMTGAELRVVRRRNMIDLSNEEVDAVRATVEARAPSRRTSSSGEAATNAAPSAVPEQRT